MGSGRQGAIQLDGGLRKADKRRRNEAKEGGGLTKRTDSNNNSEAESSEGPIRSQHTMATVSKAALLANTGLIEVVG